MIGYPNVTFIFKNISKNTKVYDIIYNPIETAFIKEAKQKKLEYVTGLAMFLGQAQESFNIWFNIKPKVSSYLISKIKKI